MTRYTLFYPEFAVTATPQALPIHWFNYSLDRTRFRIDKNHISAVPTYLDIPPISARWHQQGKQTTKYESITGLIDLN